MIKKLTTTTITQACDGGFADGTLCLAVNDIVLDSLLLGTSPPTGRRGATNKDAIKLPMCTHCNGIEILFRNWDNFPDTTPNYKTKCAINFLAKELKRMGKEDLACKTSIDSETSDPPRILTDYPSGDGTI